MPKYMLNINKTRREVEVEGDTPLLYVLRDHLELNGPKFGCGVAQCGSCGIDRWRSDGKLYPAGFIGG